MKARLDKNEMPFLPPNIVINAVKKSIAKLNRYTSQEYVDELTHLLANYNDISPETIFLSPGSDIIIKEFVFLHSTVDQIIIPDPAFIIIENSVEKTPSSILKVKLSAPDFRFPYKYLVSEIDKPTLIVVDNPNNPTGKLIIEKEGIKKLLNNDNITLLVDEAYFEFSKYTVIDLIETYPNLAILRTLSKSFGLAGSGIGYLITGEKLREKFKGLEIMLPYPSVIAASAALKHRDYIEEYRDLIQREKQKILEKCEQLNVTAYPSNTNFVLINTEIPNIVNTLAKQNVFVYDASNYFASGYIRASIGLKKENDYFLKILEKVVQAH
ncbi:MAG: aminotransferase class I/II-fold pyridoxal phosphate-dependent enzyme [Candidatus Lokiarchaeota archaeon]|nr:aminotransferase class I/II-fold pyridoxal phosphate-dependent enzyme [Candidatus Lokiarchaeota archaeon]